MNSFLTVNSTHHEFCDTSTSAPPHVMHALQWRAPLALFLLYCELFSVCELFTNRELHFGSAQCDARTTCGKLHLLFFYCAVNSFPTVNSLPTVNSVMHAFRLCPMKHTLSVASYANSFF